MAKRLAIEVFRVDTFARFDAARFDDARFDDADRSDAGSLGCLVSLILGCLVASMPLSILSLLRFRSLR
jgi:hypothetical protein